MGTRGICPTEEKEQPRQVVRRQGATATHVLAMELPPHGSLTNSIARPGGRRAGLFRGVGRTPQHRPPGRAMSRRSPRFLTGAPPRGRVARQEGDPGIPLHVW
jgi:hypothetical protein